MLNVEIYNRYEKTDHDDIERLFAENIIILPGMTVNRDILCDLEHGRYCNEWEFMDRFGRRCPLSYCSTSTKAALLVANAKCTLDLAECSLSARDYILTHFSEGSVIIYESATPIAVDPVPVDIQYRNYHITQSSRLSHYLRYEFPWRPDLVNFPQEDQGIEVIDWKQPWGENGPEDRVVSMLLMLWNHPETALNPELIRALETETEALELDWDLIQADLWDSGVRFSQVPKDAPLVFRKCIAKMQEKDG